MSSVEAVRARLWEALQAAPEGLARASHAYLGRAPEPDEWPDFLDFAATEWLDDDGYTLAERLEPACARWPTEVHTSLWIVDGHGADTVQLRDIQDDHEVAVDCPAALHAELPRRTLLRARLVPWGGRRVFFGEPASFGVQGVIARLGLLEAWREGPEPSCLAALAARRRAFGRQRDQHRVWRAHFGADVVRFPDADTMEAALATFLERLHDDDRGPDGTRPTRRELADARRPPDAGATTRPARVELRVADELREVPPAAWFDAISGVTFLAAADVPAEPTPENHPLWSRPSEPSSLPELGDAD